MHDILILLRPHQYIKNLFVFAPLFFSFQINLTTISQSLVAFILFSFIASSIYILNDYKDINEDKKHPKKKFRPLASEKVSKKTAIILFATLATTALVSAFLYHYSLFLVLLIYFILNISYSLKLKHIAIVDIFIISMGFVLRLYAGSVVTGIYLSHWIILITFLLALFLALAKRRDDVLLSLQGKETRKNIDGYNLEFINASMVLMAGVVIVSYILYSVSNEVTARVGNDYLYLTSFFVILGVMRYMQSTFVEQNSGSPTKIILKDRFLHITIFLWLLSFMGVIKFL